MRGKKTNISKRKREYIKSDISKCLNCFKFIKEEITLQFTHLIDSSFLILISPFNKRQKTSEKKKSAVYTVKHEKSNGNN